MWKNNRFSEKMPVYSVFCKLDAFALSGLQVIYCPAANQPNQIPLQAGRLMLILPFWMLNGRLSSRLRTT